MPVNKYYATGMIMKKREAGWLRAFSLYLDVISIS